MGQEKTDSSSPELRVVPYESLNDRQLAVSGESFPEHFLVVCDKYYRSCTCFNVGELKDICPVCHREASKIPLTIDENSEFSYNERQGLNLRFGRKLPLR